MQPRDPTVFTAAILFIASCASTGSGAFQRVSNDYRALEAQLQRRRAADDRVLESATLDRATLIHAVLDRNPSLESVRQAWRATLAREQQVGVIDDPMISASFAPLSIGSSASRFGYEVEIAQRLPLGGKLAAQSALASVEAELAETDYQEARLKLAQAASELYDDYGLAVRSLEIQEQHIALLSALEQNVVAAYESGHATVQDSLEADAELARLEYQKTVYETQRAVAIAQLNALLHRDPDAHLPPPAAQAPHDSVDGTGTPLADYAIEKRPDQAAAQARTRLARARVRVADTDYYPDLTLSASYNSMWDMPEHRFMAGVSLNVPLQRGRRQGAHDEAAAMRSASESTQQSAADVARGEVAVAARQLEGAQRAVILYEQRLVPIARARIEAARAGFVTAKSNFTAVIEAERGLRSAELELELARADQSKRRAMLDRTLGRVPGLDSTEANHD
jgi:cobalt-zinc-cadmium efflux system outer membrane protein